MGKNKYDKQDSSVKWVIFGLSVAALFWIFVGAWAIVRIIDGEWLGWQLPAILGVIYIVVVPIGAMFTSIGDISAEIEKERARKEEKDKAKKEKD